MLNAVDKNNFFRFGHSIIDNEFQGIFLWDLKDHFFE